MSTGGVFQLISNKGQQDSVLYATKYLLSRIKDIECMRMCNLREQFPNKSDKEIKSITTDWAPTMSAIEKTHIMFTHGSFKPFVASASEYVNTPVTKGQVSFDSSFNFTVPQFGQFVSDMVLHIRLSKLTATAPSDKVRWTEYLGHRLLNEVSLHISNMPVDKYTSDDYNAHFQFKVPPRKKNGYLRSIGQEVPEVGYLTAFPTVDEVREYKLFGSGPQTFKNSQPAIDLWIPLLFWCRDHRSALPNFLIPHGLTEVVIKTAPLADLISFATYPPGTGEFVAPTIELAELHSNHIFILPEVHELFVKRFGFQLIRVHRQHVEELDQANGAIRLTKIRWPVESLFVGFRPKENLLNSQKWHHNMVVVDTAVKQVVSSPANAIQINNATYLTQTYPIDSMSLESHNVELFSARAPEFYNQYMPYRRGKNLNTPIDQGWMMMDFNFDPNSYQPSGHINVSTSRELYLKYNSSYITPNTPTDLIVLATCINFLYSQNGSAVLRYTT